MANASLFDSYMPVGIAEGAPQREHGRMAAWEAPGLGVVPRWEVLGESVVEMV